MTIREAALPVTAAPTASIERVWAEPEANDEAESSRMYVWNVPYEEGKVVSLEVGGEHAQSVDDARTFALDAEITFTDPMTGLTQTRPLNPRERQWVLNNDPQVSRDVHQIAFEHDAALTELDARRAQDAAYAQALDWAASLGTGNAGHDGSLVGIVQAHAAHLAAEFGRESQRVREEYEARATSLTQGLLTVQNTLASLIDATGFAPPKPEAPRDPSCSGVVVQVPAGYADVGLLQERVPGAMFVTRDMSAPLDDTEREGLNMLARFGEDFAHEHPMSNAEAEAWDAIMTRVVASFR